MLLKEIVLFSDNVDVNVTPDKRQVFLEGEKIILATVKVSRDVYTTVLKTSVFKFVLVLYKLLTATAL